MHYVGRISRESAVTFLLVEKEVKGGNSAVPNNDEISPGLRWRLIRAARYPLNPPGRPISLSGQLADIGSQGQ